MCSGLFTHSLFATCLPKNHTLLVIYKLFVYKSYISNIYV